MFAYDPNAVVLLDGPHVLGGSCVGKFKRPPVVAEFMIRGTLRVFVCSVHLTPAGAAAKAKAHAQYEVKALFEAALPVLTAELGGRVRSCIFVGDFNLDPSDQEFNSLRHCGHAFQHLNDMASNCECLVEKGKILDNVWVSKQMLQLVARVWPNNRKAVTLDWDVAAFENWKTLQGYTGMATRLQQDLFKDFLLSQYLAKAGEEKKKQTPVKCFSHTGGASDHRPLLFALNCNRDAVTNAELSRAPGVNQRAGDGPPSLSAVLATARAGLQPLSAYLRRRHADGKPAPPLPNLAGKVEELEKLLSGFAPARNASSGGRSIPATTVPSPQSQRVAPAATRRAGLCSATLETGKRAGKPCKYRAKDGTVFCGHHKEDKASNTKA